MKKQSIKWMLLVLAAVLLVGCAAPQVTDPAVNTTQSNPPATESGSPATESGSPATESGSPATESAPPTTESKPSAEKDFSQERALYAEVLARYQKALSEKWSEEDCLDKEVSDRLAFYYEGNPFANVGFCFPDLNNDGKAELVIGAIYNADKDPAVFEIWTQTDGKAEMLARSGSRDRYYLYREEGSETYTVANEAENGAANHATHYLTLKDGKLAVKDAVIFDALVNEEKPWFSATDYDWDVSNDQPLEESVATDLLASRRSLFAALPYLPFGA